MQIVNVTKSSNVADNAKMANTVLSRMVGLLNRSSLGRGEALVITRCQSIHMLFMRFPIDVIFVDKDHCVVGLVEEIKPFRLSPLFIKASFAIELAAGAIARTKTALGDHLRLEDD